MTQHELLNTGCTHNICSVDCDDGDYSDLCPVTCCVFRLDGQFVNKSQRYIQTGGVKWDHMSLFTTASGSQCPLTDTLKSSQTLQGEDVLTELNLTQTLTLLVSPYHRVRSIHINKLTTCLCINTSLIEFNNLTVARWAITYPMRGKQNAMSHMHAFYPWQITHFPRGWCHLPESGN